MGLLSLGGDASRTRTTRDAFSQSSGSSFIDPSQQPFLDFTRNMAMGVAGGQLGNIGSLFGVANNLGAQGQQFLGGLGATTNALANFGNPAVQQAQIGQLGQDLGAFFNQQVLPGINRNAIAAGGLGGGRNQVARGVAAGEAARAFTGGATDIMAQGQQQRLSGLLGASQSALGGLGSLQGMFNLAQSPFAAQFSPLLALSSIVGGPTTLSRQQATSRERMRSRTDSGSFEIGFG